MKNFKIFSKENIFYYLKFCGITLAFSFALIAFCELMSRASVKSTLKFMVTTPGIFAFILTSIALTFITLLLKVLTTKASISFGVVGVLMFIVHIVNYFKSSIRSEPFLPWDILLVGEAADISGATKYKITIYIVLCAIYVLAGIGFGVLIDLKFKSPNRVKYRFSLITSLVLLIVTTIFGMTAFNSKSLNKMGLYIQSWNQLLSYKNNGFLTSFIINMKNFIISPPENYSEEEVLKIVDQFNQTSDKKTNRPNIIYIMSEAFCDITRCQNVDFGGEILPNYKNLCKNYLSGNVITAQFGGGTSNSEFEVLTGYSNSYLPTGTVPYMQYITRQTDTYTSFLKNKGYSTVAIHPYHKEFWNRDRAYDLMGFEKFISDEDFKNPETIRKPNNYISDNEMVKMIISQYEDNLTTGKPFINFSVSMGNHGSYSADDYSENELIKATAKTQIDNELLNMVRGYATGANLADKALGNLISYFEKVDEPTVIVLFGDHLPSFGDTGESFKTLGYYSDSDSEQDQYFKLHSTPYVVWNNFQNKDNSKMNLSMYQLSAYVCEKFSLDTPPYFKILSSMKSDYTGNAGSIYIKDTDVFFEPNDKIKKLMSMHQMLQYDNLLGKQYSRDRIWIN